MLSLKKKSHRFDPSKVLRSQHFTAVEVLRNQLDELQIPYKKLENPSHVTAVELKSEPSLNLV